jgi:hypothetical protein
MRYSLSVTAAALVLVSTHAFAGVVITSTHTDVATKQSTPATIYIETDRFKMMTADTVVIYRGDQNRAWVISPQKSTYMEFTPESLRALGGQIASAQSQFAAAQAQLQAQLSKLPPDQRALVEAQLGARGLGGGPPGAGAGGPGRGSPPQVTYTKVGQGKTVANWRCDSFVKSAGGQKEEDVCLAQLASTGLSAGDFRVLESFGTFMAPISSAPMMPHSDYMNWTEMNKAVGFDAFPLDTVLYISGKPAYQETVQKIDRSAIPGNAFDLPSGLTKQEMPGR